MPPLLLIESVVALLPLLVLSSHFLFLIKSRLTLTLSRKCGHSMIGHTVFVPHKHNLQSKKKKKMFLERFDFAVLSKWWWLIMTRFTWFVQIFVKKTKIKISQNFTTRKEVHKFLFSINIVHYVNLNPFYDVNNVLVFSVSVAAMKIYLLSTHTHIHTSTNYNLSHSIIFLFFFRSLQHSVYVNVNIYILCVIVRLSTKYSNKSKKKIVSNV